MSYEAVYRTAPATPGLLMTQWDYILFLFFSFFFFSYSTLFKATITVLAFVIQFPKHFILNKSKMKKAWCATCSILSKRESNPSLERLEFFSYLSPRPPGYCGDLPEPSTPWLTAQARGPGFAATHSGTTGVRLRWNIGGCRVSHKVQCFPSSIGSTYLHKTSLLAHWNFKLLTPIESVSVVHSRLVSSSLPLQSMLGLCLKDCNCLDFLQLSLKSASLLAVCDYLNRP